jgi:hypothetical protein
MSIAGLVVKGGVTTNATPTFSPVAGAYGPTQTVTITSATSGSTICYTTNGDTPTAATPGTCDSDSGHESSISNGGTMTVSATETVKAIGTLSGDTNSSVGSAAYTINGAVATPSISPASGNYASTQSVTITDGTAGASIIYTTDGSTPGTGVGNCTPTGSGATYSGAFNTVSSSTETVKAIGCEANYVNSSTASNSYTIAAVTTTPTLSPTSGYFFSMPAVTLADTLASTTIYYTTDGSTPTTGSSVYSTPLTTTNGETIKAAAIASGYVLSGVASGTYNQIALTPLVTDTFWQWTDFTTSPTPQLQQQGSTTCGYTYCGFSTVWPNGTAAMTWMDVAHTNGNWTPLGASGVNYPVLSPDGNGNVGVQNVAGCSACLLNNSGSYGTASPAPEIIEYTAASFPANQWFDTTVYGQSSDSFPGLGPCIHLTSASAGYCASLTYGIVSFLKLPSTTLTSTTNTQMTGTVKLDVTLEQTSPNNYAVLINGTSVLTALDSSYPTGNPGIYVGQYQSTSLPPEIVAAYGGVVGSGVLSAPQSTDVSIPGSIYTDALSTAVMQPPWVMTPGSTPAPASFSGQTCGNAFQSAEYRVPTGNDVFGQFTVNHTLTDGYLGGVFITLHHQDQEQSGIPGAGDTTPCTGNICYDAISYYCGFEPLQNNCAASTKAEYCSPHFHCTKVTPQHSTTANQVESMTTSTYTAAVSDNVRVEYHGSRLYGLKQVSGTGQWTIVFQAFDADLLNSPGYTGLFCGSNQANNYLTNWQTGTLQDYADIQESCTVTNSCGTGAAQNGLIY